MKRILIAFYCATALNVVAQTSDSLYKETFQKLDAFWTNQAKSDLTIKHADGTMMLHSLGNSSNALLNPIGILANKDYLIETAIKCFNTGNLTTGYGLQFGTEGSKNYSNFLLSPDGKCFIFTTGNGSSKTIANWVDVPSYKKEDFNILKVVKKEQQVHFYVNNQLLISVAANELYSTGGSVGYYISSKDRQLAIDYLTVQGSVKKINLISNYINGTTKENLGKTVNTLYAELSPVISADGKFLYMIRDEHPLNTGTDRRQDIWVSELLPDGTWSEAKNVGAPLNNTTHNFLISLAADNNSAIVNGLYNPLNGNYLGHGISKTTKVNGQWTMPRKIEIKDYVNNNKYGNFCLSQDHQVLISSAERPGGMGDLDLYVCFLQEDGTYSAPLSLGKIINSASTDGTPFLASDNKTLYFSSEGHAGYGSADIFVSKRLDDTWTNWSVPLNLGPEINTSSWDAYFTIPAAGDYAYMVSYHNSFGSADIVRAKLPQSAKPDPVVLVKGKVLNKNNNQPLGTKVEYIDLKTNKVVGTANSNDQTGEFNIVLQYGKKYGVRAEKEGFYAINDFLDLTKIATYQEVVKTLYLVPVEVGATMRLSNVFFEYNKADIQQESADELERLLVFLQKNTSISIEISGHTDASGSDEYNLDLSKRRAEAVRKYLIGKGIASDRLTSKGFGKTKPVGSNATEEGKALNRRVEFTILKK